jgi:hypothetical protein
MMKSDNREHEITRKAIACDPDGVEMSALTAFFDEFSSSYALITKLLLAAFDESDIYELLKIRLDHLSENTLMIIDLIKRTDDDKAFRQQKQILKNDAEIAAIGYVLYQISYRKAASCGQ